MRMTMCVLLYVGQNANNYVHIFACEYREYVQRNKTTFPLTTKTTTDFLTLQAKKITISYTVILLLVYYATRAVQLHQNSVWHKSHLPDPLERA